MAEANRASRPRLSGALILGIPRGAHFWTLTGRLLLVVSLLAGLVAGAWTVSRSSHPASGSAAAPALSIAELTVPVAAPLPPLTQPGAVPMSAEGRSGGVPMTAETWAAQLAAQVGIPAQALAGYGLAELMMRARAPGCRVSWGTLAGVARVIPAAAADPQSVAASLCAAGRDMSTMAGWLPAIRSFARGDEVTVEKILAATAVYGASSLGKDAPTPAARQALGFALDQLGLPYVWGGNGPANGDRGFDCSGLTTAAYASAGITLPRTADSQYRFVRLNPRGQPPRPGDLVFWGNPAGEIHHVGLFLGGDLMINAPTFGMPVQINSVRTAGNDYAGSGRP